ncbi:MAG: hypothetical protein LBD70_06890 [Bifidobacteriaceae bacterium]|jgi:hypothetical protein|nr:hypothetical protein [Bifidobacteriaceae bacterium]
MRECSARFAAGLAAGLRKTKRLAPESADWLARVLIAAADGLQIQWWRVGVPGGLRRACGAVKRRRL